MKKIIFISSFILLFVLESCCDDKSKDDESFNFVFVSDIHLQKELHAVEGFMKAIDTINKLNPDFVISGGDQVMDALAVTHEEANAAYDLYLKVSKNLTMPLYNTMGNHDYFGLYSKDEAILNHADYGKNLFERKFGKSYYSFEHKGWKFMILNSVAENELKKYHGLIDADQVEWIKDELKKTDSTTAIVLSTHFPFISAYNQRAKKRTVASSASWIIENGKDVLDLFNNHNLKLVLQGHLHIQEDIEINGVHYITGGSIASNWWKGSYQGFEEGFLKFTVHDNEFDYEFVDYGWKTLND